MSISENIQNAFLVVGKTYESIEKLMIEMDTIAPKFGYEITTPKFLRWKSDIDYMGWFITSFIKLYQIKKAEKCISRNGLRNDNIYCVDISLEGIPCIYISKFKYRDLNSWGGISVTGHRGFNYPVDNGEEFQITALDNGNKYYRSVPKDNRIKQKYWDIEEVVYTKINLVDVNSDNISDCIFGEFDRMRNIE